MNKFIRLAIVLLFACSPVMAQTVISNVFVQSATASSATIVWTTNTASTSQVKYGFSSTSIPYSNSQDFSLVTSHSMTLPLLNASQPYYFAVVSVDNSGIPTQSGTVEFSLCGSSTVPVSGTVNFAYGNGSYTMTFVPPAGSSGPYTVCGQSFAQTVTGTLNTSGSFSAIVSDALKVTPGPGTWTISVSGAGSIGGISVSAPLSAQTQDVTSQLQSAAISAGLTPVTATASACNPAWVCASAGSTIISSPQFAMYFQPIPGSASTAQGDPLITSNGLGTLTAKTANGVRNAASWQTGGGNNGIANAQANNQMVIADPSYASTELPGLYSYSAVPLHYQDHRQGMTTDYYHNPNVGLFGMGGADSGLQMGQRTYCVYDQPNNSVRSDCTINGLQVNTPGFSIGNPPGITTSNWAVQVNSPTITVVRAKGITETLGANQTKYAIGDNTAQYNYVFGPGGMTAASDEGTKAFAANTQENTTTFAASCVAGCTPSSRSILTSVANGSQGNGLYLTDVTQTPISANVVSTAAGFSGATAVTIDATVPVSTAWGTLASTQNTPVVNTPPFTTNMTFNVNVSSGTFVAGGLVCFGGNFHEQAIITSVSGSGPVTLVVPLRMPHITGSVIVQGGMCGSGLEETGSTTISGFRYLYDVIGSTTANTLQVTFFRSGAGNAAGVGAPLFINLLNTTYSSGTTVYGSYNNSGTLVSPWTFPGLTLTISNSSDAALNAPCTNMQWSTTRAFTCTIVGLTGIHTTTTAPVATSVPPIKLWPMAEVLDVQNETTTPPTVDGTLALEPNVIQFAPSDTVVINHHLVALFAAATFGNFPQNPYSLFSGISVSVSGHGAANGGTSQTSSGILKLSNQNLDSFYTDYGGAQVPPNMISLNGAYYEGLLFAQGPKNQGSLFYLPDTATHINNPNYNYNFFNLATKNGGFAQLKYVPNTANFSWNYGVLLLNGAGIITTGSFAKTTMTDNVAFANMISPTPTLTTSLTGGNPGLTDNTQYCYTVSPQNTINVEQRGTEACITTGNSGTNSNSITVSWAQVPAATIYRVCRGTTGAEQAWTTTTGTESTTLFDNGSIGAGGTCLGTVGGSLGSVDNPASVNFNSAGSTFKGVLKAPASLGSTQTYTLPAAGGTLALATTQPLKVAVSITPAATAATSCVEQAFNTFTGLATGQGVSVSPPALPGTHVWIGSARVSAANTLAIGFCADATGGTAAAGTYTAVAF